MSSVVTGADGVARCPWALSAPEYVAYHDHEWGRPVGSDDRVFEKLCLEGFQSGLSWLVILRKRAAFRDAFASFDPSVVQAFGEGDIDRLLSDAGIVRNRAKILATIGNARATMRLRGSGLSLAGMVWEHEPPARAAPPSTEAVPGATEQSKALSARLRREGFRFVGPTTVYAAMQSLGVVNDHLAGCAVGSACDAERAAFTRPTALAP